MLFDTPFRKIFFSKFKSGFRSGVSSDGTDSGRQTARVKARTKIFSRNNRKGAATVEMAFVAPFVLFIIFGSVEFSRMMMVKQSLTNSAREGCRHATLANKQSYSTAEAVVRDQLQGVIRDALTTADVRVTITPPFTASPSSGTEIVTTVEVDCSDVSWFPSTFLAGAKIRGVASMYRE